MLQPLQHSVIDKGRFAESEDDQINQVFNVAALHSWVNQI